MQSLWLQGCCAAGSPGLAQVRAASGEEWPLFPEWENLGLGGGLGDADAVMGCSQNSCQNASPRETPWLGLPEMCDDFN